MKVTKHNSIFITVLIGLLLFTVAQAQDKNCTSAQAALLGAQSIRYSEQSSVPSYIEFYNGREIDLQSVVPWIKSSFHLDGNADLKLINIEKDKSGMMHYRYRETYNRFPVTGTMYIVHTKNGKVLSMNGLLYPHIEKNTNSISGEKEALGIALSYVHADQYKWQNPLQEQLLKKVTGNRDASWYPAGSLAILPQMKEGKTVFYLAWKFNIYTEKPFRRQEVYVDASGGEVISSRDVMASVNTTGTAATVYSGVRQIITDSIAPATYLLRETTRGKGIETFNLQTLTAFASAVNFADSDNYWNNINSQKDQYAADAHWGAEETYDFYFDKFGRNSIDDSGFILLNYVHYGVNVASASWDGYEMIYGDGGSDYSPFTSIEIIGHEISHGVTDFTSDLGLSYEAGAINEGFSDCMGIAIRDYAKHHSDIDWVIGDEIGGTPLRDISNPNLYSCPDTYKGTYWDIGQEIHKNSMVFSHWFYLLAEGGIGSTDFKNVYNVGGIGLDKAIEICYRTNTVYLTPISTYADARTYSIQAAIDLYGLCSEEMKQVMNAWYAVGVGSPFDVTADFSSGIANSCSAPLQVEFRNNSVNGSSYLWEFGNGDTSTQYQPIYTYTTAGAYTVRLIVSGEQCSSDTLIKTAYVNVADQPPAITGPSRSCCHSPVTLTANGTDSIYWYLSDTSTTPIAKGNNLVIPQINSTITYYAASAVYSGPLSIGAADSTIGAGSYYTAITGFYFNCYTPATLVSLVVYAKTNGNRQFSLRDSTNAIITSKTVNLSVGKNTVFLNFNLPVQNKLELDAGGFCNLYRNNIGASYPYTIPGVLTITGNTAFQTAYYYGLFDWQIQVPSCFTERSSFTVTPDSAAFTYNTSSLTVSFTENSSNALSWQWKFGDNDTSIQQNPVHTYSNDGTYYVTLVAQFPSCSDTTSQLINVVYTGTDEQAENLISVFPNPFSESFSIKVNNIYTGSKITILDMLGNTVYETQLKAAVTKVKLHEPKAGIYLLKVSAGNKNVLKMLVKG